MEPRATGKDIILAVVENMQQSCEPLLYNTLVPSHYDVYLHRSDYERLSPVLSRIRDESVQALEAKLAELNKRGLLPGLKKTTYEPAEKNWSVKFHVDENDELVPGDVLIDSRLALPQPVEYGAGTKTQRSSTLRSGGETKKLGKRLQPEPAEGAPALARLSYKDQNGAECEYLMTSAEISIGRGGRNEFCDLELNAPADVSRQHVYLRRDPESGEFFIQDVSKFGTSVNGQKLAPKEWVRIPPKTTIVLADRLTIEFQQL